MHTRAHTNRPPKSAQNNSADGLFHPSLKGSGFGSLFSLPPPAAAFLRTSGLNKGIKEIRLCRLSGAL